MATTRKLRAIPLTGPATTAALAANLEAVSASLVRAAQDLQDHLHAAVVAGMHEAPGSAGLDDTFKQWNASVAFGAAARQLSEKFFNVAAAPIVLLAASPAPRQGKQTKAPAPKATAKAKAPDVAKVNVAKEPIRKASVKTSVSAPAKAPVKAPAKAKPVKALSAAVVVAKKEPAVEAAKATAKKMVAKKVARKAPSERAESVRKLFIAVKPQLTTEAFTPLNMAAEVKGLGLSVKSSGHYTADLVKAGLLERQGSREFKLTAKGAAA